MAFVSVFALSSALLWPQLPELRTKYDCSCKLYKDADDTPAGKWGPNVITAATGETATVRASYQCEHSKKAEGKYCECSCYNRTR